GHISADIARVRPAGWPLGHGSSPAAPTSARSTPTAGPSAAPTAAARRFRAAREPPATLGPTAGNVDADVPVLYSSRAGRDLLSEGGRDGHAVGRRSSDRERAGPRMTTPTWLNDAVLYQIYPQSFADSNGDGIGDLRGIAEHLDYLAWLGITAVWLNPCFVSPMRDAGYDVADYLTIAPRYGDNHDLPELADQARARGIRLLLDLVPGHTSDTHPWFVASAHDEGDHRYIWAGPGPDGQLPERFVRSPGSRTGGYLPNFFDFQPALNFGYARQKADEPWRQDVAADGPRANRAALRTIIDHWLRLGVSGFRVDMAYSLVKDDPDRAETTRLWREVRAWLDRAHPDTVLLSEWGDPALAVPAGFHADFFLHFGGPTNGRPLRSLWSNGTSTEHPEWATEQIGR